MDWILNHLQIVVAAAGAIAYLFNQKRSAEAREERKEAESPTGGMTEDTERTRRIQEEIRRKIAERRGAAQPPPMADARTSRPVASPVLAPRPVANVGGGGLREKLETKLAQAQARERARVAAQDRKEQLEGQLRDNETVRLTEQRRLAEISLVNRAENKATAVAQTTADALAARGSRAWLDDLRNPQSARRAIVLREVLGEPVGLR
jgi:hypothetical protein